MPLHVPSPLLVLFAISHMPAISTYPQSHSHNLNHLISSPNPHHSPKRHCPHNNQHIQKNQRDPHQRPHAIYEIDHLALDALVGHAGRCAELRLAGRGGPPAYAREEAVFAEDRDGVDEEDGDWVVLEGGWEKGWSVEGEEGGMGTDLGRDHRRRRGGLPFSRIVTFVVVS